MLNCVQFEQVFNKYTLKMLLQSKEWPKWRYNGCNWDFGMYENCILPYI